MFLGKVNRPAPLASEKRRIFLVWGQSHIGGGFDSSEARPGPMWWHRPYPTIPGCKIFDKRYRAAACAMAVTNTDSYGAHSGEQCQFRDIAQGMIERADVAMDTYGYYWEDDASDGGTPFNGTTAYPRFPMWHVNFARMYREYYGGELRIVPFGVGGSTLADRGTGAPYWDAAHYGDGDNSLLEVMMDGYWKNALLQTIAEAGDRSNVEFGGVVSLIGTSEVFSTGARDDYGNKLGDIIDFVRGIISPGAEEDCPWLIIKSPRAASVIAGGIDVVRDACDTVADARTGVTAVDMPYWPWGNDNLHFGYRGNDLIGATIYNWAIQQTPLVDPQGDA